MCRMNWPKKVNVIFWESSCDDDDDNNHIAEHFFEAAAAVTLRGQHHHQRPSLCPVVVIEIVREIGQ